jgi:hypothetical protein
MTMKEAVTALRYMCGLTDTQSGCPVDSSVRL